MSILWFSLGSGCRITLWINCSSIESSSYCTRSIKREMDSATLPTGVGCSVHCDCASCWVLPREASAHALHARTPTRKGVRKGAVLEIWFSPVSYQIARHASFARQGKEMAHNLLQVYWRIASLIFVSLITSFAKPGQNNLWVRVSGCKRQLLVWFLLNVVVVTLWGAFS